MAYVSVLYIADEVIGPHLQLIRNVCDPISKAKPHVTVRYFKSLNSPRKNYGNTVVPSVKLIEPGAFNLNDEEDKNRQRTVFIKCDSAKLKSMEYKPHYPYSELHITLYNGKSASFAKKLLNILNEIEWDFTAQLPAGTTLKEIELKPHKKNKQSQHSYSESLKKLFESITSMELSYEKLLLLSDDEKLEITRKICRHLEAAGVHLKGSKNFASNVLVPDFHPSTSVVQKTEIHLTPPELAYDITKYALKVMGNKEPIHFGDPAVGLGIFYMSLLKLIPACRLKSAIGIDISDRQINELRKTSPSRLQIIHGDFLHMETLSLRTLILANPPYLRHQEISSGYKKALQERASVATGINVSARAGMYVFFILLSHKWMMKGATAAWLIPSEFMQTDYGKALREYFCNYVQLVRIHNFSPNTPKFENAMVLTSVVIFKNVSPTNNHEIILSNGENLSTTCLEQLVSNSELKAREKWTIPLREQSLLFQKKITIGDIFFVHRGIATGANASFILERKKAKLLGIPASALRPILPKIRALKTDIIESDVDGYPIIDHQLCLIDCNFSEEYLRKNYPSFMEYLDLVKIQVQTRYLIQKRNIWYSQEKRMPAPFLCTYMGRQVKDKAPLKFIWNKSQAIAANTYILLYPKERLKCLLKESPQKMVELFEILKATAMHSMDEDLRTYAGGLRKIEPRELLNVRLTSSPQWLCQTVDQLKLF